MKRKIIIFSLLLGVPGAMVLSRLILQPVNVAAGSVRDDQIAAELRAELARIYLKRYTYPATLDVVWNDPEFTAILDQSFLPTDRTNVFTYASNGETYEFSFTNGNKLVVERGIRGIPSREVVKLGDPVPPPPADLLAATNAP
ncbi:MAG TPA: hypothetical protein VJ063_06715 [Verrucomicrobiae bacterium]|nr:hypothetical protein [Verrucomicrobiae bacterium]